MSANSANEGVRRGRLRRDRKQGRTVEKKRGEGHENRQHGYTVC